MNGLTKRSGKLIIGAPSLGRSWILGKWFDHIRAAIPEGWEHEIVLLLPENDTESIVLAEQYGATVLLKESESIVDSRRWDADAFVKMASLRNRLLTWVRESKPSFYVSVDTDILVHPKSIASMIDAYNTIDCSAVGGLSFLTEVTAFGVNCGLWNSRLHDSFRRGPWDVSGYVDVIMAFKLMDLDAVSVGYSPHRFGEDAGWALNMLDAGYKIWFDTSVSSRHVRSIRELHKIDARCGY